MGHRITRTGVSPTEERIANILAARSPRNKGELKSFIGLMTYNVKVLTLHCRCDTPLISLVEERCKLVVEEEGGEGLH